MQIDQNNLIPIIEKIATDIANKIVTETLAKAQYSVPAVPDHHHNGSDASILDPLATKGFQLLPATSGGVVSPGVMGNQSITQGPNVAGFGYLAGIGTGFPFNIYPVPIIYGNGVGVDSEFNGGDAPEGTVLFFENGPTISGMWVKTNSGWRGSAGSAWDRTV